MVRFLQGNVVLGQPPRWCITRAGLGNRPEELSRACIEALRAHREGALGVLDQVVATGHAKLRERVEQIVALTWPGKITGQSLDERKEANQSPVSASPVPVAERLELPARRTS
jgi:hypothetical protein